MRTRLVLTCAILCLTATASAAVAGERSRTRFVEGRFGHGFTATRGASWGDGAISRLAQRTFNNGASQSAWSTVYRTDDGYGRTRAASGSGGGSVTGTKDVSRHDDGVTVNRSVTTGSGGAWSRSRTYPRGW